MMIVARIGVVDIDASGRRIAGIICANISVITNRGQPAAHAIRTYIVACARIAIVTGNAVVRVNAAGHRIAGVRGADVSVVANQRRTAHAHSRRAGIVGGTGVAVIARGRVVDVVAPTSGVTEIVRAGIAVVAVHGRSAARSTGTGVVRRAGVTITADVRVVREDAAEPRVAGVVGADVAVVANQRRTTDADAA
jgi:hypothetical protein